MSKVLNVAGHAIDLDDGRVLAPGEEATGVNLNIDHNRSAIGQGLLLEIKIKNTARRQQSADDEATGEDKTK